LSTKRKPRLIELKKSYGALSGSRQSLTKSLQGLATTVFAIIVSDVVDDVVIVVDDVDVFG